MPSKMDTGFSPETLVLMLSNQCNGECDHCVVDSKPEKSPLLDKNIIAHSLFSAANYGIYDALVYGGEPFLHYRNLLPYTIEMALDYGMTVQLGTNGFWGHSKEFTRKVFDKHQALAQQHNKILYYSLSGDIYHQKNIPSQSIANIIIEFVKGNYPNLRIGLSTFDDIPSQQVVRDILRICWEQDVILCKGGPQDSDSDTGQDSYTGMYYVLSPDMVSILKSRISIKDNTRSSLSLDIGASQLSLDKSIAFQNFIVPISAGRYQHTQDIQFYPKGFDKHQQIILAPDGNAYMLPAQISKKIAPVPYRGQSFSDLVAEVSNAVKGIII